LPLKRCSFESLRVLPLPTRFATVSLVSRVLPLSWRLIDTALGSLGSLGSPGSLCIEALERSRSTAISSVGNRYCAHWAHRAPYQHPRCVRSSGAEWLLRCCPYPKRFWHQQRQRTPTTGRSPHHTIPAPAPTLSPASWLTVDSCKAGPCGGFRGERRGARKHRSVP